MINDNVTEALTVELISCGSHGSAIIGCVSVLSAHVAPESGVVEYSGMLVGSGSTATGTGKMSSKAGKCAGQYLLP